MDDTLRLPRLPKPDVPRPNVALPTVALAVGAIGRGTATTVAALTAGLTAWAVIPVNAACSFALFTVLHDSAHRGVGRARIANEVLGRIAAPFVTLYASFPMFRHIHLTHHRFVNEGPDVDPDEWMVRGPWWQLPLRWMVVDVHYARFYAGQVAGRPRKEVVESLAVVAIAVAVVTGLVLTGNGPAFLLVFLIPQRIALVVLAWWFDWLPHHGLEGTTTDGRLQSTRNVIGLEWLLTPLLFSQNYHLVHHLHPIVPFYRYVEAWRQNEEAYLAHDPALSTVSGRTLSVEDYRALRGLADASG